MARAVPPTARRAVVRTAVVRTAVVLTAAAVGGAIVPPRASAQAVGDTLPRFGGVLARADSAALVGAANDALQGRSSIAVPMRVTRVRRESGAVELTLRPVETPGVVWRNLGGTVRVLADGRRVVVARE